MGLKPLFAVFLIAFGVCCFAAASATTNRVPVIYCTDLFHPHDDPDDHFDLAAIYAIRDLELKGIILDQGAKQLERSGKIPVSQLNCLTRMDIPCAIGLSDKLRAPDDKGSDQKAEFQNGIDLILRILRQEQRPVSIVAVGSLRDVTAAYNREPDLFRKKAGKILIFIGEGTLPAQKEYNVELDPQAYIGLMRSGLPIHWVPCFDGGVWKNNGHASFWQASHKDLLQKTSPPLLQYFIYALEKEASDPIAFLSKPVDPAQKMRLLSGTRNLWCTAVFRFVADNRGNYPFRFAPADVSISNDALITHGKTAHSKRVLRFEVKDPAHYAEAMTAATADLLGNLGLPHSTNRIPIRPHPYR